MKHALRKIFLHPGDFLFAEPGTHIHTVLGSCVAITLWHPHLRIGGMCHFVLPSRPYGKMSGAPDGRYGDEAMMLFDQAVRLHRTSYPQYQAKIFGGADICVAADDITLDETIGERNAAAAMQFLMKRNVDVRVVHVGEEGSRRIAMDMVTGDVWVKYQSESGISLKSQSGRQ
jgi:chemotaxis protein CheD